ncbi:MAG: hypothetical protein ATN36_07940 [Epulopiscium sp. Nele67-Bin005]|nr:MAG: hypothetical protein ATN36_07940 [Epulopiscium sp. Nele67-Bin005]
MIQQRKYIPRLKANVPMEQEDMDFNTLLDISKGNSELEEIVIYSITTALVKKLTHSADTETLTHWLSSIQPTTPTTKTLANSELEAQMQNIKTQNSTYAEAISELEAKIYQLNQDKQILENELSSFVTDMRKLNHEKLQLQSEKEQLIANLNDQKNQVEEISQKEQKLIAERDTYKLEVGHIQHKLAIYHQKYAIPEEVYNMYTRLPPVILQGLSSIFKGQDTVVGFLLCGAGDYRRLEMFWDYIEHSISLYPHELNKLNTIFDYLFDLNRINHPQFKRLEVGIGTPFDAEYHIRTGRATGIVKEVVLRGIVNTTTNKITRKTVVLL